MLLKKHSKCPECGRPAESWIVHYLDGEEWACGCRPKYTGQRFMSNCVFTDGFGKCYGDARTGYGPTREAAEADWAKNVDEYLASPWRVAMKGANG